MNNPCLDQPNNRPRCFEDVLAQELQRVRRRREHLERAAANGKGCSNGTASPAPTSKGRSVEDLQQAALELDLVGLALSGGGIRSATFNLGVLQGLAQLGLLQRFDYLSTVSGGGYIGGWLAAWIKREGDPLRVQQQLKPSRIKQAEAERLLARDLVVPEEPEPVHHLRSYSNYLSPRLGLWSIDGWTLVAIYLRNLLLNLAVLIPALLVLVLSCRLLLCGFCARGVPEWLTALLGLVGVLLLGFGLVTLGSDLPGHFRSPAGTEPRQDQPPSRGGRLMRFLFRGVHTRRQEVVRRMHLLVFLPLLLGLLLCAWQFHCRCRGSLLADLGRQWRNPWAVPAVGGVVVGLVFGVVRWFTGVRIVRQAAPHTRPNPRRARYDGTTALYSTVSGFVVGFLFLFVCGAALANLGRDELPPAVLPPAVLTLGPSLGLVLICLGIATEVGLHGRLMEEDAREWWGTVAGYLLIYAMAWLALFGLSIYGGGVVAAIGNLGKSWLSTGLLASWLTVAVSGALSGRSAATWSGQGSPWREWLGVVAPPLFVIGLLLLLAFLADSLVARSEAPPGATYWARLGYGHPLHCLIALVIAAGLAYALSEHVDVNLFSMHGTYANRLIRCYLGASRRKMQWRRRDADDPLSGAQPTPVPKREPNGRATLAAPIRHWLPGRGGAPTGNVEVREREDDLLTGFDPDDDILLSDLRIGEDHHDAQNAYWGPFLLVNTAINLVAGEELAWQERKADSFVLTPLAGGSKSTGYSWLPRFDADDAEPADLTLGRALAISGAAASPNMGYHTSPALSFLMTVFNVRLGWWMQNPHWPDWRARGPARRDLLLHELLGQTNEKGRYVYLSDGGHFENLGVYELVRRRCRFIVVSDADADPALTFFDLGNVIRKCRDDFGIRIDLDVTPVHRQPTGRSRWHCAVGTIHYDDVDRNASPGMLVYLKASLTGDEPSDVLAYADQHPTFPHQTTANQFFTESQFESYRALGYHIAVEVFGDAIKESESKVYRVPPVPGRNSAATDKQLFARLRRRWFPPPPELEDRFFASTAEFLKVQEHLRRDPRLRGLSRDLYPELADLAPTDSTSSTPTRSRVAGEPTPDGDTAELHAVCEMLQVMENAWLRLHLGQYYEHPLNRGWMTVFRRWTNSEAFSRYWPCLRGEFSQEFVQFCEKELKLVLWDIRAVRHPPGAAPTAQTAALGDLDREFAFEWYSEDAAGRGLKAILKRAEDLAGRLGCDPFIWVIWVTSASKAEDGALTAGNMSRAVGVIALFDAPRTGVPPAEDRYELFVWLLGHYRNQGIGRDPDCVEHALNQIWSELARAQKAQPFTLLVRYPWEERADGEMPLERELWLNFFQYYDFHQTRPQEFGRDKDVILACDSRQHERHQARPLRTRRRQSSKA